MEQLLKIKYRTKFVIIKLILYLYFFNIIVSGQIHSGGGWPNTSI